MAFPRRRVRTKGNKFREFPMDALQSAAGAYRTPMHFPNRRIALASWAERSSGQFLISAWLRGGSSETANKPSGKSIVRKSARPKRVLPWVFAIFSPEALSSPSLRSRWRVTERFSWGYGMTASGFTVPSPRSSLRNRKCARISSATGGIPASGPGICQFTGDPVV